jgi:glycosyltransferase involved in cell wall biosynthesis
LARLKTERDEYAFGFVGTLDSNHKGLDTALLALSKLPAAIKWRFEVVGEGGQMRWRQLAESLGIADRVRFLGVLPGSKAVRSWLQGIDIYLQPSHTEGLPRSLIEAMSEGCLGIGSSVSGIPELLTAQFLHPPGDADALLAVIRRVLSTPDIFEQAAERNFEISREYLAPRLAEIRREFFANFARVAASARSN